MECKCTFKNDKGRIVYKTTEPIKAMFFEVATGYGNHNADVGELCAEIGWEMYLKDSNDTPLGKLADFLAEMFSSQLEEFDALGRYEKLTKFYESIW